MVVKTWDCINASAAPDYNSIYLAIACIKSFIVVAAPNRLSTLASRYFARVGEAETRCERQQVRLSCWCKPCLVADRRFRLIYPYIRSWRQALARPARADTMAENPRRSSAVLLWIKGITTRRAQITARSRRARKGRTQTRFNRWLLKVPKRSMPH